MHRHTSFYCTSLSCAFADAVFFTNGRFMANLHQANLSVPFFQQLLLTLGLSMSHFGNS